MHLNGSAEPWLAVSIPQDIYVAATATIGGAQFVCSQLTPDGGLDTSTFAYGQTPQANVTVNLPAPITVTGNTMGLVLNLLVQQSQMYSACYFSNGSTILDYSDIQFDSVRFVIALGWDRVRHGSWLEWPGFIHQCRQ